MSKTKTHAAIMKELSSHDFRVLTQKFHVGKAYEAGTLVIVSDKPLPQYNALDNAVVLDPNIVATLDLSGTTKPYTKGDNKASKEATKS